ncbi:MarR family winged helix-turn-helix transcriptional regulator [Frondihabitans sp. 4ASC-45]|uniref:MarR family winged helix-turn-helix transcriptional regulator n=1 Tax=Frondihabitans sp. 4ASC-45 TaxID=3111636 RepID=UPI003C2F4EF3
MRLLQTYFVVVAYSLCVDDSGDPTGLSAIARSLSDEIGPFRRTLLNSSRALAGLPLIPDAQIEVLRRLFPDKWVSPTVLGRQLGLARPTVSNLVVAMERSGLVSRRADEADARSTKVGLTDLAREQLHVYDSAAEGLLTSILRDLTPAEQGTLRDALPLLGHIRTALERGEDATVNAPSGPGNA